MTNTTPPAPAASNADAGILYVTATLMVNPRTGEHHYRTQVKQALPLWSAQQPATHAPAPTNAMEGDLNATRNI